MLGDTTALRSRSDDLAQQAIRPVWLLPVLIGTGEKIIVILIVRTAPAPIEQRFGKCCIHRHSLAGCLSLQAPDNLVNDGPPWPNLALVEVNV